MKNRIALVTGGSRGIGKGIAMELAKNGVSVVVTYVENKKEADLVCQNIKSMKGSCAKVQMDSKSRKSIKKAVEFTRKKFGKIDILINNAAISQEKPFESITDDDFDQMMSVNLRGPFSLAQELIPDMVTSKWGRVVNIVSIGGQWGG